VLFNSVAFLIFLPLVVVLYYICPARYRWLLLLPASYIFYGWWKVEFLVLILFSTTVDYIISQKLFISTNPLKRKLYVGLSLISNLGLLFIFKYLILFVEPLEPMRLNIYSADNPIAGTILYGVFYAIPVGISFYTFQTLSYTLDVYYKRIEPEKHFGKFALFVSFFPQLVAGPIERFSHLMPQLKANHKPDYKNFSNAFRLMLYGFFIKICIADNLAPLVDAVYENPKDYNLGSMWFGTLGFGYQIYADFAGYSLIAQGAALCLGIRLMDNFRTPYWAKGISEFWQRWHISLSTWFRDYLYFPLGGNRVSKVRWIWNIMLVFAVSGFWHGANWTFIVWGLIHGSLYLIERFIIKPGKLNSSKLRTTFSWLFTFVGVQLAWIYFRSDTLALAGNHFTNLWNTLGEGQLDFSGPFLLMIGLFIFSEIWLFNKRIDTALDKVPPMLRWLIYIVLIWCISAWGGVVNHPFIYFQF
jgi:alginate O-acetyltransferase complex protein AlgI